MFLVVNKRPPLLVSKIVTTPIDPAYEKTFFLLNVNSSNTPYSIFLSNAVVVHGGSRSAANPTFVAHKSALLSIEQCEL